MFICASISVHAETTSVSCMNLHTYIVPFAVVTTISKPMTRPFPLLIRISYSSPCVIFQPCLCNSLDMLKRLKLCSLLKLHSCSTAFSLTVPSFDIKTQGMSIMTVHSTASPVCPRLYFCVSGTFLMHLLLHVKWVLAPEWQIHTFSSHNTAIILPLSA